MGEVCKFVKIFWTPLPYTETETQSHNLRKKACLQNLLSFSLRGILVQVLEPSHQNYQTDGWTKHFSRQHQAPVNWSIASWDKPVIHPWHLNSHYGAAGLSSGKTRRSQSSLRLWSIINAASIWEEQGKISRWNKIQQKCWMTPMKSYCILRTSVYICLQCNHALEEEHWKISSHRAA